LTELLGFKTTTSIVLCSAKNIYHTIGNCMVSPLNEHAYADEGGLSDAPSVHGICQKIGNKMAFHHVSAKIGFVASSSFAILTHEPLSHFDINCLLEHELFYSGPPDYFFVQMICNTMCNCMVFSCLNPLMQFQLVALGKQFASQCATMWFFACVYSNMPIKLVTPCK
jgi:hypothetical protein